jgi:hypothetical protein
MRGSYPNRYFEDSKSILSYFMMIISTFILLQSLVECCDNDANGCGGGGTSGPMQCAVDMQFIPSTTSYPYTAVDTEQCAYTPSQAAASVQVWYEPCDSGDEACVVQYIGNGTCTDFYTTALKTSIEVIDSFYDYVGGVYSDPECPDDIHNHAVAIVGWGTDKDEGDFWLLRNSWGSLRNFCFRIFIFKIN